MTWVEDTVIGLVVFVVWLVINSLNDNDRIRKLEKRLNNDE